MFDLIGQPSVPMPPKPPTLDDHWMDGARAKLSGATGHTIPADPTASTFWYSGFQVATDSPALAKKALELYEKARQPMQVMPQISDWLTQGEIGPPVHLGGPLVLASKQVLGMTKDEMEAQIDAQIGYEPAADAIAYREGYRAALEGQPRVVPTERQEVDEHVAWGEGWNDAAGDMLAGASHEVREFVADRYRTDQEALGRIKAFTDKIKAKSEPIAYDVVARSLKPHKLTLDFFMKTYMGRNSPLHTPMTGTEPKPVALSRDAVKHETPLAPNAFKRWDDGKI